MSTFSRRLFYFILLYGCIEGLVINMTFPSKIGFIVKDAFLVLAYAILLTENGGRNFGSLGKLTAAVGIFAMVQVSYIMIQSDLPLLAGLVGLKMRLLYLPVAYLAYRFIRNEKDFEAMVVAMAVAAIPVALFGIYLFFAGPQALRAIGGTYSAVVYSTTSVWRVPGTFNSPGQYGLFLLFNWVVVLGLLLNPGLSKRRRTLMWVSLGTMLFALFASGSRTPLLLVVGCSAACVVLQRRVGQLVSMSVALYIIFTIGFMSFGAGVADRVGSIASMEHIQRFNQTYFGQLFLKELFENPMGLGLGAATIGARHFTELNQVILMESYFGIVAIETGFIGLFTILWLMAAIVKMMITQRPLMRSSPYTAAWHSMAVLTLAIVALLPVGTALDATPGNVYFWLALGVAAKLYDLERQRRQMMAPQPQVAPDLYRWQATQPGFNSRPA